MEDIIEQVKKHPEFKKYVIEEAQKYGKDSEKHNAKFRVGEVGTKYNFSQCNDPELAGLEIAAKQAADALKARQEFLKGVPASGVPVLSSDGELVTVYPPSKTSETSVIITLK